MNWNDFDNDLLNNVKLKLRKAEQNQTQIIEGFDNHFGAISSSRTNIRGQKISNNIKLKKIQLFRQNNSRKKHIVFNPHMEKD